MSARPGPEFLVLTGFLGSGKTTLLRDLLGTEEAATTAVIVNEVGEIGLDGALLRESGGDMAGSVAMTTLANGCICCQMGSDLAVTVEALLGAERPGTLGPLDRIVLETSGLSKPGPILRQLASLARHRLRVAVVSTFDPTRGPEVALFAEAAAQWAGAHRIVVTKADAVPADRLAEAARDAAAINPLAEIVAVADRAEAVRRAFAPPRAGAFAPGELPVSRLDVHTRLAAMLLLQEAPVSADDLATWLDDLAGMLGERLLRLKGLVGVSGSPDPWLVQSVGTLFSVPRPFRGPDPGGLGFLVVIARDLEGGALQALVARMPFRLSRPGRPVRAEAV